MPMDKKYRIMQAAEELFKIRQFHEITLDEVARSADVGKGTIYQYFSDKEDLFFQTAVAGFDDMCTLLRQNALAEAPFRASLIKTCEMIDNFFHKRRPLLRMMLAEGERALGRGGSLRQRWRKRRKRLVETVADVIGKGKAAGDIRADIPESVMAEYLLGMLRTCAQELEELSNPQPRHQVLVDLFCNGAIAGIDRK